MAGLFLFPAVLDTVRGFRASRVGETRALGGLLFALLAGGCATAPPSVLQATPSAAYWQAERQRFEESLPVPPAQPPVPALLSVSTTADGSLWVEQIDDTTRLCYREPSPAPTSPETPGLSNLKVLREQPLSHGLFQVALSPDGRGALTLRRDPSLTNPREQAVLELWSLEGGEPTEITRSAALAFEPTWTGEATFLFAESNAGFNRVLEQNADGSRTQALALEAPYPRLTISPLWPEGWVIYDRTRPRDIHCWTRASRGPGPAWSEQFQAGRSGRLLGWWKQRPLWLLGDLAEPASLVLASGKGVEGETLARLGPVDFALLLGDRVALLEEASWGQRCRVFDLKRGSFREAAAPFGPWLGHKMAPLGSHQTGLLVEGPLQPPSPALLDLASAKLTVPYRWPSPLSLSTQDVAIRVDQEGATLTPKKEKPGAPILLEAYGGFRRRIEPRYDPVWGEWLQRGGVVRIEQLPGQPRQQAATRDALLERAEHWARDGHPLVLRGQSLGGTLALLAAQQAPEQFRAVWADAAVTDLVNFAQLPPGELWIPEFGDSGDPAEAQRLAQLSPLARADATNSITPLLSTTAPDDTAVDPRHSARFQQRRREVAPSAASYLLWQRNGAHGPFQASRTELWRAVEFLWSAAAARQQGKPEQSGKDQG